VEASGRRVHVINLKPCKSVESHAYPMITVKLSGAGWPGRRDDSGRMTHFFGWQR
jgi:hypothetical protein